MNENPVKIFCSYSHKDENLREELETHASSLMREKLVEIWHDRKIPPGQIWEDAIDIHLEESEIVILLISPNFIASNYCYGKELTRALEKDANGQAKVIPVIIRPTDWLGAPFSKFQALPKDGKAITTWDNKDEAWLSVVQGLKNSVKEQIRSRGRSSQEKGLISFHGLLSQEFDRLGVLGEKKKHYNGIATGFDELDRIIDGIHRSDFITIAGRPGTGRTDFAINIAANIAHLKEGAVSYFSIKHPAEQISRCIISAVSRISSHNILRGTLGEHDWPRLVRAIGILSDSPLYIDDRATLTLSDIVAQIKNNKEISVVIIDSIQHLADNEGSSESAISHQLRVIARDLNVAVIGVTPLSRKMEERVDKFPMLKDLGNWHSLEENSDVIFFLYRDELYNKTIENPNRGIAELILAKNKYGPVGTIPFAYFREKSLFDELANYKEFYHNNHL
jgi:replicative DNA helicase